MSHRCRGFRFGAVSAGIKTNAALDVGVISCDRPAAAAAVFTRNRIKAAPVQVSRAALARSRGIAQAVVVNSGNANACTGKQGIADARRMVARAADALSIPKQRVLVASTGVIGKPLPMTQIDAGVSACCAAARADGMDAFAEAILTTDRHAKTASRRVDIAGSRVTLLGCTKGAGMIAPSMATTLTFVVTDARIAAAPLQTSLQRAVNETFNAISIDGDTSTNDMALLLAGGAADHGRLSAADRAAFTRELTSLCDELARALMGDGEGVQHVVTLVIRGARTRERALRVARSIGQSPLVKTAIAGRDPNWGRILCAAGNAGVPLHPDRLALQFEDVELVRGGVAIPDPEAERRAQAVMQRPEYSIVLDLGAGDASARFVACDLSHAYVTINADYHT